MGLPKLVRPQDKAKDNIWIVFMKHFIMSEILIEDQDAWEHRSTQAKFLIYCQLQ